MVWAVGIAAPCVLAVSGLILRLAYMEGRTQQKLEDICGDTDEIRDELRDLRAELRLDPRQTVLTRRRQNGHGKD